MSGYILEYIQGSLSLLCTDYSHTYRHINTPYVPHKASEVLTFYNQSILLCLRRRQKERQRNTKTETSTFIRVSRQSCLDLYKPIPLDWPQESSPPEFCEVSDRGRAEVGSRRGWRAGYLSEEESLTQESHRVDLWPAWTLEQS